MIWRGTHLRPLSQGPEPATGVAGGTLNSPAARKAQLRRELRAVRKAVAPCVARGAAARAAVHLLRLLRDRRVSRVGVYLAAGSELDTEALIGALQRARVAVMAPTVDRRNEGHMRFAVLRRGTPLRRARFGIREPASRRGPPMRAPDVLVLPLIGFDARGTRLGSGAGYYDRWLARQWRRPFCIGYAYARQAVTELPREPWDIPLDAVCTERGLRRFARR